MIDTMTQGPLIVRTDGGAGPYIRLPLSQLPEVRRLLDEHQVKYLVQELTIAYKGRPPVATIDLNRKTDIVAVQTILDDHH